MKIKKSFKKLAATTFILALLATLLPAQVAQAAFPGLNGRVLYWSQKTGDRQIYTANIDGSVPRQLTNNSGVTNHIPRWSPDGTKIVFTSTRDGDSEIYTMNADGSNQLRITNIVASDNAQSFSPDGSKILFISTRDGNSEIYTMNVDGTNIFRLTNNSNDDNSADWSSDGKIVFRRFIGAGAATAEVFTINPDGTNEVRLTTDSTRDTDTRWSPDGTKIVWTRGTGTASEIAVMNSDGSGLSTVTNNSENDTLPDWSPDGSTIVFNSVRAAQEDVYKMNANGTNQVKITNDSTADGTGSIQPLTIPPATVDPGVTLDATKGSVVYNAPMNHTDAYEQIDSTSVTITAQPKKGSVSVNSTSGEIMYTPTKQAVTGSILAKLDSLLFKTATAQSANQDSFAYQICSTANSQLCTQAIVTVNLATASSLASTGSSVQNLLMLSSITLLISFFFWQVQKRYFV